jgi:hypothetical protein
MKAVVLKEFGGPENLALRDLPIPRVGPGFVLLRAAAASERMASGRPHSWKSCSNHALSI